MTALTSKELLKEQLEAVANRTRKQPKGIEIPATPGIAYHAMMKRIIVAIKRDIDRLLMPVLKQIETEYTADGIRTIDAWIDDLARIFEEINSKWSGDQLDTMAKQIASTFVMTSNRTIRNRFNKDMRSFGIDIYGDDPAIDDYMAAAIYDNTQLIKSIPQQYLSQVQQMVVTNARAGLRPSAIQSQLVDRFNITQRRARFIARDQTAKMAGDLAAMRQQASGFEYFRWKDSGDSRVRERHREIADAVTPYGVGVYRWDDLPLSESGERIKPGSDYGCRCTAIPVSNAKVEAYKRAQK